MAGFASIGKAEAMAWARPLRSITAVACALLGVGGYAQEGIDLGSATVVVRPGELPSAERMAAVVLIEEVERRTGIRLSTSATWPADKTVIAISAGADESTWGRVIPVRRGAALPERRPEGYRISVETPPGAAPVIWIVGADPRGALYGVGALLRNLAWSPGRVRLPQPLNIATAPVDPIRGHQLGYRARANSWDGWDVSQFDQYIRELAVFGTNCIENIPFEDSRASPVMKVSRREMNRRLSEICERYDLDYWVWTPADFDLSDSTSRAAMLARHELLYRDCRRLNAVFFPGGDPGHNPPELVLPFLEDIADRLVSIHPEAKVWLSLQWFNPQQVDFIYAYIQRERPKWLGGLVAGPSSPPIAETRRRLPAAYRLRRYPDITHNKLCQFPVPWWDQAYALTLGREAINPRPIQYAQVFRWYAPYADGFITYSDGVHDDVNKVVWSVLGWDPTTNVRDILVQYARFFFGPDVAEVAADGILALEKNWQGALADNGAVDGTLLLWRQLEERSPQLRANWRWQMSLVRAYCDAYIRHRLLYESALEREANAILAAATTHGSDAAMDSAREILGRVATAPCRPVLRHRISELCDALFHSVCLQTSVSRYYASGAERGAFLDFIDYPLNNRWWLEDEFAKVAALPTEAEKCRRLKTIGTWETPGRGSFYDDIGHVGRSPHVRRGDGQNTDPIMRHIPQPTFWWWDNGMSRRRLSWQCTMDWPQGVVYEGLDPKGGYTVRLTGYGQSLLRVDGDRVTPSVDGKEIGQFKEFHVPPDLSRDGRLVLTWDVPANESHLNWRQKSRVAEVWLIQH